MAAWSNYVRDAQSVGSDREKRDNALDELRKLTMKMDNRHAMWNDLDVRSALIHAAELSDPEDLAARKQALQAFSNLAVEAKNRESMWEDAGVRQVLLRAAEVQAATTLREKAIGALAVLALDKRLREGMISAGVVDILQTAAKDDSLFGSATKFSAPAGKKVAPPSSGEVRKDSQKGNKKDSQKGKKQSQAKSEGATQLSAPAGEDLASPSSEAGGGGRLARAGFETAEDQSNVSSEVQKDSQKGNEQFHSKEDGAVDAPETKSAPAEDFKDFDSVGDPNDMPDDFASVGDPNDMPAEDFDSVGDAGEAEMGSSGMGMGVGGMVMAQAKPPAEENKKSGWWPFGGGKKKEDPPPEPEPKPDAKAKGKAQFTAKSKAWEPKEAQPKPKEEKKGKKKK